MLLLRRTSERLERRRRVDDAWRRYVQDGLEPVGVGEEISRSWSRCRDRCGIDPGISRPGRVLSLEELAERAQRDEVLGLAAAVLRDFSERLDLSDHALAYFDREGWMLSLDGDRQTVDRLAEISFRPGTSWSEASAGTNGPGTALASGAPVEVFAAEHFVAAWHPWSCAAAPIFAPGIEGPVGLVDLTGPWEVRRRKALLLATVIARAIEERVRAAYNVRAEVVRYALRAARESGDALVAVDAEGRVLAANDAAARRRIVDGKSLPPGMRAKVLGALRPSAQPPGGELCLELPAGGSVSVSMVRYEGSPVGAIVRATGSPGRRRPRAHPTARYDFGCLLGESAPFLRAVEQARVASRNDLPVVLFGESGTGKELLAHAIHGASKRRAGPLIAVNCGSIPAPLIEAELFGHEPGAFTGARQEGGRGRFEDADGGTLLLDEVSELPPQAQTALLRLLQEKEVVRLGSSLPRAVDVRVVAATNERLEDELRAGRFRRDLYYRLNVLPITVPPLRERGDDVLLLARVFLAEAGTEVGRCGLTLGRDVLQALRAHAWPGNVRELRNVLLRAAATAPLPEIAARDLLLDGVVSAPRPGASAAAGGTMREVVRESGREALLEALDASRWNFAKAAAHLGISRMTLYRMLRRCGISRDDAAR